MQLMFCLNPIWSLSYLIKKNAIKQCSDFFEILVLSTVQKCDRGTGSLKFAMLKIYVKNFLQKS